tara:strand:+ start:122 stop:301 length:180 start_codon:yes stop_codon:yes gene_type:complete
MPNKAQMEIFTWLEELRAGGKVNMFGAPQLMEQRFGMTPEEAKTAFWEWTQHLKMEEDG